MAESRIACKISLLFMENGRTVERAVFVVNALKTMVAKKSAAKKSDHLKPFTLLYTRNLPQKQAVRLSIAA
jgi:hypothetical protein